MSPGHLSLVPLVGQVPAGAEPKRREKRGGIRQDPRTGRWRVRWYDAGGKRQSKNYDTHREAKEALREHQRQVDKDRRTGRVTARQSPLVRVYAEGWLEAREGLVVTHRDDATRLRLHVLPRLGSMPMAHVRPRHVKELVLALRRETDLAPRTIRLVYAVMRQMFASAYRDEVIESNPVDVDRGVKPKNVDADPEWREEARFSRDELEVLISDPRVPPRRRVLYALEGLTGARHGEAAGLRWRHYTPEVEPAPGAEPLLGRLIVACSYGRKGTKTGVTREVPVHPTLAVVLENWRTRGWAAEYGRKPEPDDLIVMTERETPITAITARKYLVGRTRTDGDLRRLGLRTKSGSKNRGLHEFRRAFLTLASEDGVQGDVRHAITHASKRDMVDHYTRISFPQKCRELLKLRVALRVPAAPPARKRRR